MADIHTVPNLRNTRTEIQKYIHEATTLYDSSVKPYMTIKEHMYSNLKTNGALYRIPKGAICLLNGK